MCSFVLIVVVYVYVWDISVFFWKCVNFICSVKWKFEGKEEIVVKVFCLFMSNFTVSTQTQYEQRNG